MPSRDEIFMRSCFDETRRSAIDTGGGNAEYKLFHSLRRWITGATPKKSLTETKEKKTSGTDHFNRKFYSSSGSPAKRSNDSRSGTASAPRSDSVCLPAEARS